MKILKLLKKEYFLDKLTIISFGLFPILPNSIKGLPVFILALNTAFNYFKNKSSENNTMSQKRIFYALVMTSVYICYLLSIFYTENLPVLGQKLETSLSLLLIPLCFFFTKKSFYSRYITTFKVIFIVSTVLFIFFFWANILVDNTLNSIFNLNSDLLRKKIDSLPLIPLHPIYASMIYSICLFLLLSLFRKINNYVLLSLIIILGANILVLASKMAIISLFLIIVYFLLKREQSFYYKIITIFVFSLTVISTFVYVPTLRHRFDEITRPDTYEKVIIWNSTSIRKGIYDCSMLLLKKQWIFGYGIGDVQDNLNYCYLTKSDVLFDGKYNSHNQYLSIWLGTGLFGFLVFSLMLAYNFIMALRNKDLLFQVIIIFFTLNFLTENILQRQAGVILFAFLINLFGWYNLDRLVSKSFKKKI
ncbi:MAG: O-antigen ligase family protein [Cellulophaga sp.]|nr:O-antigen ligase family protein [Cellulophaga sp.]